jgi:lysyl-tRNA synthetase class 2
MNSLLIRRGPLVPSPDPTGKGVDPFRRAAVSLAETMGTGDGGIDAILRERRQKADDLAKRGWPSHPNGMSPEHTTADVRSAPGDPPSEPPPDAPRFSLGGRLKSVRRMGKVMFCDLWDRRGKVQLQIRKDLIGEALYENAKLLDMGDIVLVSGPRIVTKTGELTIQVHEIRLATKSLYPLPDMYFGLEDVEARYRQRYVDMIVHDGVRETFLRRNKLIRFIRRFLDERDFLEVETPMLHDLISGAAAKPFITHHNALDMDLYCRIAPELHLKRLVVGGFDRVYEIGRNFRNEGLSVQHNPEFTMLEFYWAWATYETLIEATEAMLRGAAQEVTGGTLVPYGEHRLDFGKPFARIPVRDGLRDRLPGVDISDPGDLAAAAAARGQHLDRRHPLGRLQMDLFELLFQADLVQPTFVVDFPLDVSPLARRKDADPTLTDRFELYVAGREIANAFSELNDPDDQRSRFTAQVEARAKGDDEAMDYDDDYCRALEIGMPPTAGEGVGIDRLAMLLTNSPSIRDVILFPQMRRSR